MMLKSVFKIIGLYLLGFCFVLLIPLCLASYYQFIADPVDHPQPHSTGAFLITLLICGGMGKLFHLLGGDASPHLFKKEGIAVVALVWFLTPAIAGLPFFLSNTLENPLFAYFEAASGLTTTGSTVLHAKNYSSETGKEIPITIEVKDVKPVVYKFYGTVEPVRDPKTHQILYSGIEAVSKALLFWRSFIQWLGGVGVIVLFVAVLPSLGVSGKLLARSEMPGPLKDALAPRIKQTAIQLWLIYMGLTIFQVAVLLLTNEKMEWLDAVTISFSTLSTGGFSIRNANIAYYQNAHTDWVIIVFMILGATNFSLYYYMLKGMFYRIYKLEFFLYCIAILLSCGLCAWYLYDTTIKLLTGTQIELSTLFETIRYSSFHAVSSLTSTGFVTADYDLWPYVPQVLLFIIMFVGGMSGSTSGGIKMMRQYMLFRIGQYQVESLFLTHTIRQIRVYDLEINTTTSLNVLTFFLFYIVISVLGTFLFVLDNIDPQTALGLVGCMINNCGLSFRGGGPTESCAFLSNFGACLSTLLMILGRLEFFVILALLVPAFWKKSA